MLAITIGFLHTPVAATERLAPDAFGASDADNDPGNTIIVTGVRGGKPRTVAESPAPIDVVQPSQAASLGRADLSEALSSILPSFGYGSTTSGVNSIVRPIFNRGLGPAYTLVLVNGKRRHNGSLLTNGGGETTGANPVDLDQIPASSIAYVEVLKDSAAAQYGSDAVAGVINIVLKSDSRGGHVGLFGGSLYEGDGNRTSLKAETDAGFKLGPDGGFLHVAAEVRKRGMAWNNFFASALPYSPASNPLNANWNGDGAHNGDPQIKSYALSYNASLPVNENTSLYSDGTFGQRWAQIGNNYRRPNSTANINQIFPAGYYPFNNTRESDSQFLLGLKGEVSQIKWDLSTSYGRNRVVQYSDLSLNPSLGTASPTSFDNLATYQFDQWVTNLDLTRGFDIGLPEPLQISAGAEYRIERFRTFAGDPLGYANGEYVFKPGDQPGDPNVGRPASVGAQGGVVLRPGDVADIRRENIAGYVDVAVTPVRGWYVSGALRVENYSDFSGAAVGYKFNSRYDVTNRIAIRGTVGSGFRAPSLTQMGYAQTDNRTALNPITGTVGPAYTVLANNRSALAHALGAQDLKPEKSWNYGLGLVFKPTDNLNLTIDAYQIKIRNRIARTGTLFGPAINSILVANGLPAGTWVNYFANAADTRTRGIDVVSDYRLDLGGVGKLYLDASFNYNKSKLLNIVPTPAILTSLGPNLGGSILFFPRSAQGDISTNLPKTKIIAGIRWDHERFSLGVQGVRYGSLLVRASELTANDVHYGAKLLTNVNASIKIHDGLKLTVGAANLFNVHPDQTGLQDPNSGAAIIYYGNAPFSYLGGSYYARATFDF